MNLKTWAPLAVAIILGLFAAKLGRDMLGQRQPTKANSTKFAQVVVANDTLAAGAQIKPTDLQLGQFPENGVPPGAFRTPDEVVGRVLTNPMVKGQPVLESVLAPVGSAGGLTAIVPDGMRAVTVEVNETSGVAGMLAPGCRVDIVTTLTGDSSVPAVAKTVARNLLIVGVGRRFGTSGNPDVEAPPARSVTLLASPKEAEVVELACRLGNPRLVLRGARESHEGDSEGTTLAELRGTNAAASGFKGFFASLLAPTTRPAVAAPAVVVAGVPTSQPSAAAAPGRQYRDVQVIKGTVSQTVKVEIDEPRKVNQPSLADTRSDLEPVK